MVFVSTFKAIQASMKQNYPNDVKENIDPRGTTAGILNAITAGEAMQWKAIMPVLAISRSEEGAGRLVS